MQKTNVDVIALSMARIPANHMDNSIINSRNVDTIPPADISLHSHPFYALTYVVDTEPFPTYVNDVRITFTPGCIYIFPPDTLHSPKNRQTGELESLNMKFYIHSNELAGKTGTEPFFVKVTDGILSSLKSAFYASMSPEDRKTRLPLISEELIRLILNEKRTVIKNDKAQYDLRFIRVLKYMYESCNREIALEDLASVAHMERTAFAKKFKAMYNITPINYLYSIRLSRSLDLLMTPGLSISKIAKIIGFNRATAFSAAFSKAFNMSPTEYRNQLEARKYPRAGRVFGVYPPKKNS